LAIKAQPGVQPFFAHADSLYNAGKYADAVIAYERAAFFADTNRTLYNYALLKKAQSCKLTGNYQKSFETLQRTDAFALPDTLRAAVKYETVLNAYLAGLFKEAELELKQYEHTTPDTAQTNQLLFLKILTLNELQKWAEAKTCLEQYLVLRRLPPHLANEYYAFMKNPRLRNPQKARRLSTFMPGIGQIYGGNVGQGVLSAGLQAGFLAFGVYHFWQGFYVTGFTTGFALFQAFYFGGIENAEQATVKKNKQKINAYNERIKQYVLLLESE